MNRVGLDVHKVHTQICILTDEGECLERRCRTTREALPRIFGPMERSRILLEASTESEWVARCLESLGHEVIVADPNYAPMYGGRRRKVKTDSRDSFALARACDTGVYRPAHRLSQKQGEVRATLHVRTALVRTRCRCNSVTRALLRREGYRVSLGAVETFVERVRKLEVSEPLVSHLRPILITLEGLHEQIAGCDEQLSRWVQESEVLRRLCTAPGIGPVTAVTFVSVLDTPERFAGPHQAEAYVGLVPSEWSSGEKQRRGQVTKTGNGRLRALLVEAAWRILRSKKAQAQPLRLWAERIRARRGKKIAAVALARKLAGILFAMWRDGRDYDLTRPVHLDPLTKK
jgi:transposase